MRPRPFEDLVLSMLSHDSTPGPILVRAIAARYDETHPRRWLPWRGGPSDAQIAEELERLVTLGLVERSWTFYDPRREAPLPNVERSGPIPHYRLARYGDDER